MRYTGHNLYGRFNQGVSSPPPPDPKAVNQLNQVVNNCFDVAALILAIPTEVGQQPCSCHRIRPDKRRLHGTKRRQKCGIEAELTRLLGEIRSPLGDRISGRHGV